MKSEAKNKNIIWYYLICVIIFSYGWQYLIFRTGGVNSKLFPLLMLIPGIIALVFLLFTKSGFRKIGWGIGKWKYIFPAVFIPLVVSLGLAFLIHLLGAGSYAKLFEFKDGMLESTSIGLLLGKHQQTIGFFVANLVLSHIVFLIGGSLLTIGEELGWRGYMQEAFLRKFGLVWGFIIAGAIWGYWHLPIILMGYNFPNNPIVGALLLMPLSTMSIGLFLGWIYLRSRSIWMPALAHTSINLFSGFLFTMDMESVSIFPQLIWIVSWGLIAILCLINLIRVKPEFWQKDSN